MHDFFSHLFVELLRLVGISVDGEDERTQALAMFAFGSLFGVIAGCLSSGLTSTVWFSLAGLFVVLFLLAKFWTD